MLRAPAAGVSRIGPVFTPRSSRGRGYGSAVTAAAAHLARRGGVDDVVLFADLANPTSNAIYQRIGFEAGRRFGAGRLRSRIGGVTRTGFAVVGETARSRTGPRTVALVAKTKTRTSGRVSNRFWKLLGASTDREQARSLAQVSASEEFDEKAADLDDEQLKKATAAAAPQGSRRFEGHSAVPRDRPRSFRTHHRAASVRRPAARRPADAGRRRHRDGHRRGQDAVRRDRCRRATRSRAGTSTSSPSTTTWPSATPNGWARCWKRWG